MIVCKLLPHFGALKGSDNGRNLFENVSKLESVFLKWKYSHNDFTRIVAKMKLLTIMKACFNLLNIGQIF
jgi:hypothetical protein